MKNKIIHAVIIVVILAVCAFAWVYILNYAPPIRW